MHSARRLPRPRGYETSVNRCVRSRSPGASRAAVGWTLWCSPHPIIPEIYCGHIRRRPCALNIHEWFEPKSKLVFTTSLHLGFFTTWKHGSSGKRFSSSSKGYLILCARAARLYKLRSAEETISKLPRPTAMLDAEILFLKRSRHLGLREDWLPVNPDGIFATRFDPIW